MKKSWTVLMAAAECRGYAKVGGLADVVYDLSVQIQAEGGRALVVLPLYEDVSPPETVPQGDFLVRFEGQPVNCRLHRTRVAELDLYLIEAPLFQGEGGSVYVDSGKRGKGPFEDDARRFAFFSAAVWELVKRQEPFAVDVVHCHDWHTGPIPLLARLDGHHVPTLFTIHNLDYQGTRPFDEPYAPGASWRQWFPERWDALKPEWKDLVADPRAPHCFNPLRCGIRLSDAVNTVSPTYAQEITKPDDLKANFFGGRGLEADLTLRAREKRLWGILNGLDYHAFDPESLIPAYEVGSGDLLRRRGEHRTALWADLPRLVEGLSAKHGKKFANADVVRSHLPAFLATAKNLPLTVCVTRAVSQKLGLFTEDLDGKPLAEAFLAQGTALLVVGTGELEEKLSPLNNQPAALFLQVFDADFATRLYSAGELFLMPSDFEPCGISQLMALRYGCLPLVHDRGGLHDTVKDGVTGFVFQGATREAAKRAFLKTAKRAVEAVRGKDYEAMVRAAMAERFEWAASTKDYRAVYQKLIG